MAVNINTVYTTVLFILNKEQRGYIPPAEFNSLAQQVQQEIFDSYFPDGNQLNRANQKNIQNDTEFFNMFKDNAYKVAYFEEDVTFSYDAVNEVWLASTTRPLYRIGEIISTSTGNPTLDSVTELASKKDFTDIKWEGNNILLFGSEGFGMRQHTGKYADFFVKININQDIESLNISNSAAIVFHHLSYIKKKS